MSFITVYDACVLYPPSIRDLLVRLAQTGLFAAKWSEAILDEIVESIVRTEPEVDRGRLERTRRLMCEAVRDCIITGYERLCEGLELPDPDDRHVLAAAIRAHAQVIVTFNLSDFPAESLDAYAIEAQSPDEFVLYLIDFPPPLWPPSLPNRPTPSAIRLRPWLNSSTVCPATASPGLLPVCESTWARRPPER